MADEMNTDERAKFIHWHMDYLHTDEMLAAHIWDNQHSAAKAWQARAALSPDAADLPEGITRDDTVHGETYYTAEDMATASAQGFRDGVASLSAPLQIALDVIERWARDAYVVCGKPSTQEGFEAAWKAEDADAYAVWVAGRASLSAAEPLPAAVQEPDGIYHIFRAERTHETVTKVIHQLRAYNPLADEHGGKYIHKGWANLLESVAPPKISESDAEYWLRNRASILRAIEERGFRLVSSGGLFWLSGNAKDPAPTLTQVAAIAAGAPVVKESLTTDIAAGAVYAEMPEFSVYAKDSYTEEETRGFDEADLRDFADRTHAIRIASHGQAPAQPAAPIDVRAVLGPLLNEFGERQWQSGAGVVHKSLGDAFEAVIEAAENFAKATPSPQAAQQAPAGAVPIVELELPDGDTRSARVGYAEMKNGVLHLCISVEGTPAAPSTPASPTIEGESK